MTLIQILIIAFVFFAAARTLRQFKKGKLTLAFLFLWLILWVAVAIVVLLPNTTTTLAHLVGVGRGVDAIIYISILVLFYLVFRLLVKIEDVEREITRLVREITIKEAQEREKKE